MPRVQSPRALAAVLVATFCFATATAAARDNPIAQGSCSTVLTATQVEMLPTADRNFSSIAGLTPGVVSPLNVDFRFNRRGAPTHVLIDGQELDVEARVRRFNPEICEVLTQPTKTLFGSDGVSGVINFAYRAEPEPWAQATFTNLRKGGDRFPNFQLEYRRAGGSAEIGRAHV